MGLEFTFVEESMVEGGIGIPDFIFFRGAGDRMKLSYPIGLDRKDITWDPHGSYLRRP